MRSSAGSSRRSPVARRGSWSVALRSTRLFPGGGLPVVSPAMVLIEDGTVVDVDATGARPPQGAEVVDLGDATLLPGLVDSHVHLCFDGGPDPVGRLEAADDAELLERMHANALAHLAVGVTTVRDLGDRNYLGLALRERYATGGAVGPEVLAAGPPITPTGGHCWFLGGEADGAWAVRAAAAERARRGCDVVKIMATGGLVTAGSGPHDSQYGPEELAAAVGEAHRHGLPIAAHAHGPQGIADAVAAGVDSVEHCSFFTPDGMAVDWGVVERMVERGTVVGTTMAVLSGVPLPPAIADRSERLEQMVIRMHRMGARLVCSSDAGIGPPKPHGVLPHGIVALARLGLPNADALETATGVAAAACWVGDRKGRIAPGYDADVLALDGDPLSDIEAVLAVRAVFRAGVRVR